MSGLPHAVVKQSENVRVRELVKKIESHPHRQALQTDLQQSNAYNPCSEKSKKMIRDMGNVELFELCETIPKVQCSECLSQQEHPQVSKMASIGRTNLSWDKDRLNKCKWLKGKRIGAQAIFTQRNNLEEVR